MRRSGIASRSRRRSERRHAPDGESARSSSARGRGWPDPVPASTSSDPSWACSSGVPAVADRLSFPYATHQARLLRGRPALPDTGHARGGHRPGRHPSRRASRPSLSDQVAADPPPPHLAGSVRHIEHRMVVVSDGRSTSSSRSQSGPGSPLRVRRTSPPDSTPVSPGVESRPGTDPLVSGARAGQS